ncbi:integrase [Kitasatospora sp. MAP12-15]|uniref:tyrosine-type recombinase/integrase n=1 Tax=unclassified Kitasatospora TaxID=2633591 RepID=UPI0024740312|nr:tyrosine-type recombinase/integrase [Kitasatospora sp. MAP12-44]MDH6107788.1 integrase [Kitasatospora sp. MAP12-44]
MTPPPAAEQLYLLPIRPDAPPLPVSRPAPDRAVLPRGADPAAWAAWLTEHTDPVWRAGEWDPEHWLFTGQLDNPRTTASVCRTAACDLTVNARNVFCAMCTDRHKASGLAAEEFAATYVPQRDKAPNGLTTARCAVTRDGVRCVRPKHCRNLCCTHYSTWHYHQRRGNEDRWWSHIAIPFTDEIPCLVPACPSHAFTAGGLCGFHSRLWTRDNRTTRTPAATWAKNQPPYTAAHQFSLVPLADLVRREVLYALQQADQWAHVLNPSSVRSLVRDHTDATTLLCDEPRPLSAPKDAAYQRTLKHVHTALRTAFDDFTGQAPNEDILDLRRIGLRAVSGQAPRQLHATIDLAQSIHQTWLRRLLRFWASTERPRTDDFTRTLRATTIASRALAQRPGAGHDPTTLRFADVSAVIDAFRTALKLDGTPYSSAHRNALTGRFFQLIDYGRRADILDDLAGTFSRDAVHHTVGRDDENEDEIGKAIPESVIRQLDARLDTIGHGDVTGRRDIPEADLHLLYRTVYTVLRDTGRRPLEVASLSRDCLETDRGQTSLIWDNHKRRRHRRRLPITATTAQAIREWQERRNHLDLPASGDGFLFPALTDKSPTGHLSSSYISETLRLWVASIPRLDAEGVDAHGTPLPFDRTLIYPYAFRHSYAQRHADAGTPVDVLRELMDHKSIAMTQRYYHVSLKRKQAAVTALSAHVVDRHGQAAPASTTAYQLRQVAVPYGGCTEPSNVKAGGSSCPIRFQCAGCGFYRPDPSYLPAIEQHINELRADRETALAMDAAEFVVTAFTAQITAFEQVVTRMNRYLAAMPAHERAELEEASTVLRRARAGTPRQLLPLTVVNHTPTGPQ